MCTGVYADSALPDTVAIRVQALALVIPPGAVACRRTAAWIHAIDALRPRDGGAVPLEVAVPEGLTALRRRGLVSYVERLDPDDVVRIGGVPVTNPVRTVCDLGRWLPRYQAVGVIDEALRTGLVTRTELRLATDRWFTYAGVRQLRELVEFADPRAESPRESWLRLALHDAGFPPAVPQVRVVRGLGLEPFRLDLAWPELMVAIEYDGAEAHGPERSERDEARRAFLRSLGWAVIVVRRGDLERPDRLAEAVAYFVAPVRPSRGRRSAA